MSDKKEYCIVISGEISHKTSLYEGGLYDLIDRTQKEFGISADRDAVIDVFDTVGYYTERDLTEHISGWVMLFLRLTQHKGLANVSLTIEENQE
jgi:hypothetical protein